MEKKISNVEISQEINRRYSIGRCVYFLSLLLQEGIVSGDDSLGIEMAVGRYTSADEGGKKNLAICIYPLMANLVSPLLMKNFSYGLSHAQIKEFDNKVRKWVQALIDIEIVPVEYKNSNTVN